MFSTGRLQRAWAPAAGILVLTGCAIQHQMVRIGPAGWCPAYPFRSEVRFSPSGVDRGQGPEVTWYGHTSREDQRTHSAWCEAVGPPAIVEQPHPSLLSPPGDTLSFVAWNVWMGGGELVEFLDAELGLVCTADGPVLRPEFEPFVLLLQEVFRRSTLVPQVPEDAPVPWKIEPTSRGPEALDILGVAEACGLALAYVPSARNGTDSDGSRGEDKGNAILSTLPLRSVLAVELPFEAGRKVAVGAELQVPRAGAPTSLVAVSVHLDLASTLFRTLKTGNRTRERQAEGLLEALEARGWSIGPSVVGGDFNTWSSRDASLKVMNRSHPDSPPLTTQTTRGPFPADHLFFRADREGRFNFVPASYRVFADSYGSDHQPRVFRIAFR